MPLPNLGHAGLEGIYVVLNLNNIEVWNNQYSWVNYKYGTQLRKSISHKHNV
jgi:hypothetical protein